MFFLTKWGIPQHLGIEAYKQENYLPQLTSWAYNREVRSDDWTTKAKVDKIRDWYQKRMMKIKWTDQGDIRKSQEIWKYCEITKRRIHEKNDWMENWVESCGKLISGLLTGNDYIGHNKIFPHFPLQVFTIILKTFHKICNFKKLLLLKGQRIWCSTRKFQPLNSRDLPWVLHGSSESCLSSAIREQVGVQGAARRHGNFGS